MLRYALLLLSWFAVVGHAEETPPGLPFQPVDSAPATPPAANASPVNPPTAEPPTGGSPAPEPAVSSPAPVSESPALAESARAPSHRRKTHRHRSKPKPYRTAAPVSAFDDESNRAAMSPPSVNPQALAIARGMLNRIKTPYANPKVLTVDTVETKVDGSAIYVATESYNPVNLFVSDIDTGETMSLQLSPQDLPAPADVEVDTRKPSAVEGAADRQAGGGKLFKQDSAYITEIKAVMRALGKRQVPSGFSLSSMDGRNIDPGLCHGNLLTFTLGQILVGDDADLLVFVATNPGMSTVNFEEASCAGGDTLAVAAWPSVRLPPGGKTEVFVMVRKGGGSADTAVRPSLIN